MRPEIEAYLASNGSKYTTKALRQQLIHAGWEAAEVDAALQETEAARRPQFAAIQGLRSRFWRWVFLLNGITLALVVAWTISRGNGTWAVAVAVVLGIFLLIGLGLSGLIGRAFLGRGLAVALIAPVIFALVLGGICAAGMSRPMTI
jgi:hypothetical protein